ncbi:MAG: Holliday junction branch migration protein RuvA [Cellvibrionales bacterium TMED49]|nr:Holliday junction branch migration protein RuvA [Porticoccaceae bacterium]OUU35571.1 MAG: Holliday junction branch migration protein RuvA [Cellvibrionales bacterium TMED49]
MIAQLIGIIVEKQSDSLLVDVNGVGYEVMVSLTSLFDTPEIGSKIKLLTHFVVREDAQLLFGFTTHDERKLFRHLIKVNGVGPKLGLAILSGMTVAEFFQCVQKNDLTSLVALPGVGKKTAERLIIEMRDKQASLIKNEVLEESASESIRNSSILREAEVALIALGFRPLEASKMVSGIADRGFTTTEDLIKVALKRSITATSV